MRPALVQTWKWVMALVIGRWRNCAIECRRFNDLDEARAVAPGDLKSPYRASQGLVGAWSKIRGAVAATWRAGGPLGAAGVASMRPAHEGARVEAPVTPRDAPPLARGRCRRRRMQVPFRPRRPCGTPTPQPAQPNGTRTGWGAAVEAAVGAPRAAQVREALGAAVDRPITPFMGPPKEGTRILYYVKPSTNMSKDMCAGNRPNSYTRNGLIGI